MSLSAATRLGPYEIVALLGTGGMGEVYGARDTKLERDVAITVLPEREAADPARRARFAREAADAARPGRGRPRAAIRKRVAACRE